MGGGGGGIGGGVQGGRLGGGGLGGPLGGGVVGVLGAAESPHPPPRGPAVGMRVWNAASGPHGGEGPHPAAEARRTRSAHSARKRNPRRGMRMSNANRYPSRHEAAEPQQSEPKKTMPRATSAVTTEDPWINYGEP